MWARWQGVRMLNCFVLHVLRLYCLRGDHVYEARLRGELAGLRVTKRPHLDQDSRSVLWTTQDLFHFCLSHAASWSYQPYLEITACLLRSVAAVIVCNLFLKSNGGPAAHVLLSQTRACRISAYKTCTLRHAYLEGSISRHLSRSLPGAAKEVSATTGNAGALPARLPPCLWMVLLSKVAVRTLERAAINTT